MDQIVKNAIGKYDGLVYCRNCRDNYSLPDWFCKAIGTCGVCKTEGEYLIYQHIAEINNHYKQFNTDNSMKLTGTIKVIFEKLTFDSGFEKQEIVITTNDQYPQDVKIEFVKEKIDQLKDYAEGSAVEVSINIRGNEYNGKYYVNIQGWKIEDPTNQQAAPATAQETDENF